MAPESVVSESEHWMAPEALAAVGKGAQAAPFRERPARPLSDLRKSTQAPQAPGLQTTPPNTGTALQMRSPGHPAVAGGSSLAPTTKKAIPANTSRAGDPPRQLGANSARTPIAASRISSEDAPHRGTPGSTTGAAKASASRTKRPVLREAGRVLLLTILVPIVLASIVVVLHFSVSHLMLPFVGRLPFGARLAFLSPDKFKLHRIGMEKRDATTAETEQTPALPDGKDPATGGFGTDIIARCKDLQKATHLICEENSGNSLGKQVSRVAKPCSPQECDGILPQALASITSELHEGEARCPYLQIQLSELLSHLSSLPKPERKPETSRAMDSYTGEECVCQQCDMLVSSGSGSGFGSGVAGTGATRAPDDGAPVSPDGFEELLESMLKAKEEMTWQLTVQSTALTEAQLAVRRLQGDLEKRDTELHMLKSDLQIARNQLSAQNASLSELLGVKTTFSELSQAKRECEEKKAGLVKELSACVSVSKLVGPSTGNAAPRENDQLIVFLEDTVEALRQEVTRCNAEATQHQQYAHGLQAQEHRPSDVLTVMKEEFAMKDLELVALRRSVTEGREGLRSHTDKYELLKAQCEELSLHCNQSEEKTPVYVYNIAVVLAFLLVAMVTPTYLAGGTLRDAVDAWVNYFFGTDPQLAPTPTPSPPPPHFLNDPFEDDMPSPDYTEQDRGWDIAKEGQEEPRRRVTTHSTIVSNGSDHNIITNNNNSSQQQQQFWASRSELERPASLTGSRSRSEQVQKMGFT